MEDKKMILPAIALRGLTVLPQMTINFDIIRGKSISAVEKAMVGDQKVLLVTQMKTEEMNPDIEDLFHVGTIGFVKQLVKMPGGMVRVTVEGLEKAELLELDCGGSSLTATVEPLGAIEDDLNVMEKEAMLRIVREKLEEYGKLNQTAGKDFLLTLTSIAGLEELLHQIAVQFPWDYEARQKILECTFLSAMYETVLQLLLTETEVYRIKKDFQTKVKAAIDKNQKDYILREQMRVIREELGEDSPISDADELKKQLKDRKSVV